MAGEEVTSAVSPPGVGMWQLCLSGLNFVLCCCICLSASYLQIKLVQKQAPNTMSLPKGHPGAALGLGMLLGGRHPRAGAGMGAPGQNLGSVRCSMAKGVFEVVVSAAGGVRHYSQLTCSVRPVSVQQIAQS